MINHLVGLDGSIELIMKDSILEQKFRKTAECPASETLLRYRRRRLPIQSGLEIGMHLRECDFCSAELQLLTRHRSDLEPNASEEVPTRLRRMAEELFVRPARTFTRRNAVDSTRLSH